MGTETDGRRIRGAQTRGRILQHAGEVATIEGLDGLSLAQLGDALGISKSGVHALFGTKEELQLETVAAARQRFIETVILPVWNGPEGVARLQALLQSWLAYVRRREFPGGCFVTHCSAEFANRPGRVRDALATSQHDWLELLEGQLIIARAAGEIPESSDPGQLAFEISAVLQAGNNGDLIGDEDALERAERAVTDRLSPGRPG